MGELSDHASHLVGPKNERFVWGTFSINITSSLHESWLLAYIYDIPGTGLTTWGAATNV